MWKQCMCGMMLSKKHKMFKRDKTLDKELQERTINRAFERIH